MAPHQQRVVDEETDIDEKIEKIEKLSHFIECSPIYQSLPEAEQDRLVRQREFMRSYSGVLHERIMAFPQG